MPIKIPNDLPAVKTLLDENIFVMTETRAITQDIRPLKLLLLNLMPMKVDTETQLSRLLGNSPLQVELELMQTRTHVSKNTPQAHMLAFYQTFDQVKDRNFDGMVITGAPVEQLPFEEVEYWEELCEIMEWSKTHVHSTFHICWGAQAALYYHFGIPKYPLPEKMFGIFPHRVEYKPSILFRHTTVRREDIEAVPALHILASSQEAGVYAVSAKEGNQFFITGHSEYDGNTLQKEYLRDKNAGLPIAPPKNYFPKDDDTQPPLVTWRSHANLLYTNWLNYFVYQTTPYDIQRISFGEHT